MLPLLAGMLSPSQDPIKNLLVISFSCLLITIVDLYSIPTEWKHIEHTWENTSTHRYFRRAKTFENIHSVRKKRLHFLFSVIDLQLLIYIP